MNHEMNTLAIGRQEAFSTMVSNKVPATVHCLSDGIHEAEESWGEQQRSTDGQRTVGKRGRWRRIKPGEKHGDSMAFWRFEKKGAFSAGFHVFHWPSLKKQKEGVHSEQDQ